jgi:hypothetical protein
MRVSLNVSISWEIAFMIKILFVVREYRSKTNFSKKSLWHLQWFHPDVINELS